jgi:acyl-CoA dehydrogenase
LPPLVNFSGDAMKQRVLPDVLAGRKIAAVAISEADAGSDVADI